MAITITAALQTGNRVAVTVAGLNSSVPAVSTVTLWRDDLDQPRTPVRGWIDHDPSADGFVAYDYEAPLARPVFYVLEVLRTDGTVAEYVIGAPLVIPADYPIVSDPISGDAVELTALETWTTIEREGRATVVDVVDRPDPIVVSQGMSAGSSDPVMRTDTLTARRVLRGLFASAQVLQIRDPHPDVEDTYVVVGKVSEQRITNSPDDLRRRHVLAVRHVGAPSLGWAAQGDTLEDLADAIPGDLGDIEDAFPGSLLDIASADLAAM